MSTPENNQVFRNEVARLREAHLTWHKRSMLFLGVWLVVGILVALGTWFMQKPIDRDGTMLGGVLALALGVFFIGCMFGRFRSPKPSPKCPQCGHDWEGSEHSDDWLTWYCCPGCGLTMSGDTRRYETP
jgi:hypothetical protein